MDAKFLQSCSTNECKIISKASESDWKPRRPHLTLVNGVKMSCQTLKSDFACVHHSRNRLGASPPVTSEIVEIEKSNTIWMKEFYKGKSRWKVGSREASLECHKQAYNLRYYYRNELLWREIEIIADVETCQPDGLIEGENLLRNEKWFWRIRRAKVSQKHFSNLFCCCEIIFFGQTRVLPGNTSANLILTILTFTNPIHLANYSWPTTQQKKHQLFPHRSPTPASTPITCFI